MATAKKPGKKLPSGVQRMFEEHGDTLLEKVVAAEGPGSAGAQAHALRTLIEFSFAKPEQRLDVSGFRGDVRIVVEGVE